MTFFDQEITFDVGHMLLLLALIGFVFFVSKRCNLSCSNAENLHIKPIVQKPCKCKSCMQKVLEQAESGLLYGCDPTNPYIPYSPEECNYQYHKAALHGCNVA